MGVDTNEILLSSDQDTILNAAVSDVKNKGFIVASADKLFNWAIENVEFDQAILEFYTGDPDSGWLHMSYNEDNNRGETLRAFRENNKVAYQKI